MQLALDFGNSAVKAGIYDGRELVLVQTQKQFSKTQLKKLLKHFAIEHSMSCSVTRASVSLEKFLQQNTNYKRLESSTVLPIRNYYKTRNTLGMDRLANLMGGRSFFPHKNVLVVSAGTCITYDVLNATGEYYGGNIAPGLDMRLKAMHTFTSQLPLVKKKFTSGLFGNTTISSMLTGALTGAFLEMTGFIQSYQARYKDLHVIITGGDAAFFMERFSGKALKKEYKIFALPHLVLYGLNEILLANNASNS
jgi:type III pantothenate kinase